MERMNAFIDSTYHAFVKDVSDARKIPMTKMPDVAKGRVFSGAQAKEIGLVDQLGGYDVALAELRKKLNLTPDDQMSIEIFPAPQSPVEKALKILKGFGMESAMVSAELERWHNVIGVFGPMWNAATASGPVSARVQILPVIK
jgi:protease-4